LFSCLPYLLFIDNISDCPPLTLNFASTCLFLIFYSFVSFCLLLFPQLFSLLLFLIILSHFLFFIYLSLLSLITVLPQ
jgi:hypothetical protein